MPFVSFHHHSNGGLGNSLYANPYTIDNVDFDVIGDYANTMFNFDNLHMVSSGIDMQSLDELAEEWAPVAGKKLAPPTSKYLGGW